MGFIVILPFAAAAVWTIFSIYRWLRRGNYDRKWWNYFKLLSCVGIGMGIWFAFFLQYNVANKRIAGFPIPVEIFSREKPTDPWTPAIMPTPVRVSVQVTDIIFGVAACLLPIAAAAFIKENRTQPDFQKHRS